MKAWASWQWPTALLVVSGLSVLMRPSLQAAGAGALEHAWLVQSDLRVFHYFVLPLWILMTLTDLPSGERRMLVLQRRGSFIAYWGHAALRQVARGAGMSSIVLLGATSGAWGLPLTKPWSEIDSDSAQLLRAASVEPVVALLWQWLLYSLTLPALALMIRAASILIGSVTGAVIFAGGFYVAQLVLALRSTVLPTAGVFLSSQGLEYLLWGPMSALAVVLGILAAAKFKDQRRGGRATFDAVPMIVALVVLGIVVLEISQLSVAGMFGLEDTIHRLFGGGDSERLAFQSFALGMLVTLMPGWLWGTRLSDEMAARMDAVLPRLGGPERMLLKGFLTILGRSLLTAVVIVAGVIAVHVVAGGQDSARGWSFVLWLLLATWLQTAFAGCLFFLGGLVSPIPQANAVLLVAMLLLSLPAVNRGHSIPFGMNLTHYSGLGELLSSTAFLAAALAVVAGTSVGVGHVRPSAYLGRF